MAYHNGMNFTTRDSDNDLSSRNCTLAYGLDKPIGGWWYRSCWANGIAPNIVYISNYKREGYLNNQWHVLSFIEIKIRPHTITYLYVIMDQSAMKKFNIIAVYDYNYICYNCNYDITHAL